MASDTDDLGSAAFLHLRRQLKGQQTRPVPHAMPANGTSQKVAAAQ